MDDVIENLASVLPNIWSPSNMELLEELPFMFPLVEGIKGCFKEDRWKNQSSLLYGDKVREYLLEINMNYKYKYNSNK